MKISFTGSTFSGKTAVTFPFSLVWLKRFHQQLLVETQMRNHSNNFVLLSSKMKTSISTFRKTIGFSLPLRISDTMEYPTRKNT
jgi:hypothetical protein